MHINQNDASYSRFGHMSSLYQYEYDPPKSKFQYWNALFLIPSGKGLVGLSSSGWLIKIEKMHQRKKKS